MILKLNYILKNIWFKLDGRGTFYGRKQKYISILQDMSTRISSGYSVKRRSSLAGIRISSKEVIIWANNQIMAGKNDCKVKSKEFDFKRNV